MPIRRAVNSTRETPPKSKLAEGEEEKPEEQENETPPATSSEAEQPKGEPESGEKEENNSKSAEEPKKDEKDQSKEKEKKVKKTIPAWATLSASQLARAQRQTPMASSPRPKMDAILTEAIKACFQKTGASVVAIRKYIIHKYPSLDLERRGYLLKQALKRELNRGVIKQVKGKGASGSFVVVQKSKPPQKSKNRKKGSALDPEPQVKLEGQICHEEVFQDKKVNFIGKRVS